MFSLHSTPLGSVQRFTIRKHDGAELEILIGWGAGLNAWKIPTKENNALLELLYGYRFNYPLYFRFKLNFVRLVTELLSDKA